MEEIVYNIFKDLKNKDLLYNESYIASLLPFSNNHKIGVSSEYEPIFFIKCRDNTSYSIDICLEYISVLFNRECIIYEKGKKTEKCFTVVYLKTNNDELQKYFINVMCLVLKNLPLLPTSKSLNKEINKIINLFQSINNPPKKTIQGLWAELFIIEQSSNPEYLIESWHVNPSSTYDFNDGSNKIEIKSTSNTKRIHSFSMNQLNPNKKSDLIIASIILIQTNKGKSIQDLVDSISKKINNFNLELRLNTMIIEILGSNINQVSEIYYDYKYAIDSLKYYNYKNIPQIDISTISNEIINIHFDVNLTFVSNTLEHSDIFKSNKLFNSLI